MFDCEYMAYNLKHSVFKEPKRSRTVWVWVEGVRLQRTLNNIDKQKWKAIAKAEQNKRIYNIQIKFEDMIKLNIKSVCGTVGVN